LNKVISKDEIDLKQLQLRLQGSVMVTVNAGSLTYANAFIGNPDISDEVQDQLKSEYIKFIDLCDKGKGCLATVLLEIQAAWMEYLCNLDKALEINSKFDSENSNAVQYHKTLSEGFSEIKSALANLGVQFNWFYLYLSSLLNDVIVTSSFCQVQFHFLYF